MSASKSTDGHPSGPDLLGKPSAAAEGHRILSQLEHGVAPPAIAAPPGRRPAWWRPAGAALCVLLATALTLSLLSTHAGEETGPAAAAPLIAPVQATVHVSAHAPPASPAIPATATATIVNVVTPATPASIAVPAVKAAERKTVIPERKGATVKPASMGNSDNDVALLAAMVAHAHRQDAGPAEPLRDVVVRKEEEETVSLLQRCKQLGLIEGMLCRSRICSGRWDSDPACH
ncbi:hypothetical protein [Janthinobacterium sp.]|uniref:hypothetical protein n=1 Tax=Janthinobacterium sp. TaxID=1871054 RepID=UPI00260B0C04|nr:hypothetical protein [Janthinobacterium sp.]